jgi:hypothetical protein
MRRCHLSYRPFWLVTNRLHKQSDHHNLHQENKIIIAEKA